MNAECMGNISTNTACGNSAQESEHPKASTLVVVRCGAPFLQLPHVQLKAGKGIYPTKQDNQSVA